METYEERARDLVLTCQGSELDRDSVDWGGIKLMAVIAEEFRAIHQACMEAWYEDAFKFRQLSDLLRDLGCDFKDDLSKVEEWLVSLKAQEIEALVRRRIKDYNAECTLNILKALAKNNDETSTRLLKELALHEQDH